MIRTPLLNALASSVSSVCGNKVFQSVQPNHTPHQSASSKSRCKLCKPRERGPGVNVPANQTKRAMQIEIFAREPPVSTRLVSAIINLRPPMFVQRNCHVVSPEVLTKRGSCAVQVEGLC